MTLEIKVENAADLPEHGWGIIGEKPGDPSTEVLDTVFPLDEKETAQGTASHFHTWRQEGELDWVSSAVSRIAVRAEEDGSFTAVYVEASNLTHPG